MSLRRDAPVKARRRRRWPWILAICVGGVVLLGAAGWVALFLVAAATSVFAGGGGADEVAPAPVASVADPPDGSDLASFAIGRTLSTVKMPAPIAQRTVFVPTADAQAFRVHVRNWNYISDLPLPGDITLTGMFAGRAAMDGDAVAGGYESSPSSLIERTTLSDGEELTTGWFDGDVGALEGDASYLLSLSWSSTEGTDVGVGWGAGWVQYGGGAGAAGSISPLDADFAGGMFLDVWVEYAFAPQDETSVIVIGHSLNTGANADPATFPHEGEISSWHQQWAQRFGGVSSTLAVPSAVLSSFGAESPKWDLYAAYQPDVVSIWAASNDLALGATVDASTQALAALIERTKQQWPAARIAVFTEPPRGLSGGAEAARVAWNEWVRGVPDGVDVVVDADAALKDPADATRLAPAIFGDGSHPSPAGYAEVAELFEEALARLP